MLLIRIVLAEQNTGVIGWLQYVGLQNEQMTHLAWAIFAGIVCGIVTSCLTIKPTKLASADNHLAGADDRRLAAGQPVQQPDPAGSAYFQPVPAGLRQRFLPRACDAGRHWRGDRRPAQLVSFSVMFGMSQNLGGLLGSAILGTFQTGARSTIPACWLTSSPPLTRW